MKMTEFSSLFPALK